MYPLNCAWTTKTGVGGLVLIQCVLFGLVLGASTEGLRAEPQPGDVFREYRWTNDGGDAGGSLRVGGKVGYGGKNLELPHSLDLVHAIRAEVVVEKLLCHAGTRELSISVNDHPWVVVPEATEIPAPQWDYQHHTYPVVSIPLSQLLAGKGNRFRLRVGGEHPWNWPQNLIYGVHLRIYYDKSQKPHPTGRIVAPEAGSSLGRNVDLEVEASSSQGEVVRVEFLGKHEDVNLEGDGRYRQWHYHYIRSKLTGHLGTVTEAPWRLIWDTSWVPDQSVPLEIAAWITDRTGLTFFSEAVDHLSFQRGDLRVELCKPYDVPMKWVTRSGEHHERFQVAGDLTEALRAKLVWCSWSPGYMEGIFINDHLVLQREGPRYAYFLHHVPINDLSVLKPGENTLTTGKTPKYNGNTVHGMEVNWPGIMLLIQYQTKNQTP
jgi:hypothetical protein